VLATGNTTTPTSEDGISAAAPVHRVAPALVLVWSAEQPERVGEVAFLSDDEDARAILGRNGEPDDDPTPRVRLAQRRSFSPSRAPFEGGD
jgi:hypothetical protein